MPNIAVVALLWRYPVKSLKRESLDVAEVQCDGISGDRCSAAFVRAGHSRFEKTYRGKDDHRLHMLSTAAAARQLALKDDVDLELRSGSRYFDAAPISILIDSWLREAEVLAGRVLDPQRFRPNIFARSTRSFDACESDLVGQTLNVGRVLLRVRKPIARCVTITYDVESGEPDPNVLRSLAHGRNTVLGIYCDVLIPGEIRLGDTVGIEGSLRQPRS
ncbi:MAG: MOSC domain-containing protein [Candidatus Eremiobacteraeota bacterium]|nr:MOSC domain-containing protein [Candidatus Eremiobacteraeota bacterium]